ncbi:MAG: ABC transporter ATP-binding protein [Planctomycetota bacterium]
MSDQKPESGQPAPPAVLRADGLQRCFVDGERTLEVLKGASLDLCAGEVLALVGRSGSGKSTLLHLLGLLDRPNGGEVLIDGTPAGSLSETDRAYLRNRRIGFVFQHYFLLPEFSVLENVLLAAQVGFSPWHWLALRRGFAQRAAELLAQTGLEPHSRQRPATLSGGERQRVALARALLLQPKILLCDEPTGNLDPDTAGHIMDLVFELSRREGTAVLVVTHDRAISERADQVLRLEHGLLSPGKQGAERKPQTGGDHQPVR